MRSLFCLAAILLGQTLAFAAQPVISKFQPLGVQRGQTTKVTVLGSRLRDSRAVLSGSPGIEITEVAPVDNGKVEVTLSVANDLAPGLYPLQVVTDTGVSNLRLLGVGAMPVVAEVEPNDDLETAQKIDLNTTIEGVIKNEDQDFFAVDLKAGETLVVEVEGTRLASSQNNTFLDPYVAILDAGRFEKSSQDDIPLLQQDGLCSYTAEEDGTYYVLVRDASFGGNDAAIYRVHVGTFPRPVAVMPPGGQPGEMLVADLVFIDGSIKKAEIQLPSEADERFPAITEDENGVSPSPNYIRVTNLPVVLEQEPNNELKAATEVEVPAALSGAIGSDGDVDCFAFEAKKGEKYRVQMYARTTIRSPLDSVVNVYGPDSRRITGNDDTGNNPDSFCEFTVAADGRHVIRINDQLGQGGPEFVYRLEVTKATPTIALGLAELDRDQAVVLPVPRGGQMAVMVNATRKEFSDELNLELLDLPEGVTATTFPMRADRSTVPVVLSCPDETPSAQSLARLIAVPANEKYANVPSVFTQLHKLVLGRNRRPIWNWETDRFAVSVADPVPFNLKIEEPQVPIVRNGSMELVVSVDRQEGFEADISLVSLYNPPGISVNNSRKFQKDATEVTIPMTANGSAATGQWPMFIIATTSSDNGAVRITSQPVFVEVEESIFKFEFPKSAAEHGSDGVVMVGVEVTREFDGEAELELVGLPAGVTCPEPKQPITAETEQVAFPIVVAKDARPGAHKTINVRAYVRNDKGVIKQTQGTAELRVDVPLPTETKTAEEKEPKAEKKAAKEPPKERPLSRLEQLRKAKLGDES